MVNVWFVYLRRRAEESSAPNRGAAKQNNMVLVLDSLLK